MLIIDFFKFSVSKLELWQAFTLGAIWAVGVTFLVKKSLITVQRLIAGEIKNYLKITLEEHRNTAIAMVGGQVETQLDELAKELKVALDEKLIAEEAQIVAEKAKILAEEERDSKSQFLSRMSHEIRTPMNGVIGSLDLIDLDTVTKVQAEDIQRAIDSSNRLLNVINEILTFSNTGANEVTYESKPFNLSSLCHEIINSLRPLAKEKDLSIDFDEHYLINQIRIGDEQKIHQVLTNLLGNAIKFTDQGEVNLIVDEHYDEKHGDWVCFAVKDTGMGVSEEKQKALFDPFYQVDESNTRKHGGTGLGLAISQKFVEGLGGKIEVESTFGAGSKFQFKLPMKYEINNNNEKPKILIVDDDDVNRTVAKRCLAEFCTEIDEAKDGKEGLSMFYNNRYDLILMDVQMPVMDGFEACREIRQHEKKLGLTQTPIIALSASVLSGVKEECIESGMNHYISKPFKKASLISEIKTVTSQF